MECTEEAASDRAAQVAVDLVGRLPMPASSAEEMGRGGQKLHTEKQKLGVS